MSAPVEAGFGDVPCLVGQREGVIVALSTRPRVSATWYVTGVATVPVNDGNGSNVTVPSGFTV